MKNLNEIGFSPRSMRGITVPRIELSKTGLYAISVRPDELTRLLEPVAADRFIHSSILALRQRVEVDDNYRRVIQRAERQVEDLPDDIVGLVLQRMKPYLLGLPTGHSIGHISRDYSNITSVLHDPKTSEYSDAEIVCGIFGGTLHDIGNCLLDKDTERGRLTKHSELGAWLVGERLADMLPPDILDVTKLAIAAHSRRRKPQILERDGEKIILEPYQTKVTDDELKRALALTRCSDRTDIQSIIMIMRQTPLAMRAKDLYLATGELRTAHTDDRANIAKLFTLDMTTYDGLLPYFREVASSVRTKNWHTEDDTPFLTEELFGVNADDVQIFVDAVREGPSTYINDVQTSFDRFLNLCRLLEPGIDVDAVNENARRGYMLLDPELQQHWAYGYNLIVKNLYPGYHARMRRRVETIPPFVQKRNRKMQAIVADVHKRAGKVLDALSPKFAEKDPNEFPNLAETLVA